MSNYWLKRIENDRVWDYNALAGSQSDKYCSLIDLINVLGRKVGGTSLIVPKKVVKKLTVTAVAFGKYVDLPLTEDGEDQIIIIRSDQILSVIQLVNLVF